MRTRDKFQIMGLTHKLKGTGIYVNEDLPPEERRKHSLLLQKSKELKQSNPHAKTSIKSGRLYYNGTARKVSYTINEDGELIEELATGRETFPMEGP